MNIRRQRGDQGEQYAAGWLSRRGYEILARNWRHGDCELDIVAREGKVLVFVEVKTRNHRSLRQPEESVTLEKWENVAIAAGAYMEETGHDWEIRFDILAVTIYPGETFKAEHFKDMYFPGR